MSHSHSSTVRVGAVSYLNTVPLVYGLQNDSRISLSFDLPSRLADQLSAGQLDVGLIPCIEFFQDPKYSIVSDACIACRGPVWSVKLLSRTPFEDIRSLALDEGSRTSAALVQILLRDRFNIQPTLHNLPMGAGAESTTADAVLIIGDRAMHTQSLEEEFPHQWDLGEQWSDWSGLSFVFAMWVAREGVDRVMIEQPLSAARDGGVEHLAEIASAQAAKFNLTREQCLHYLRDNLYFHLGRQELAGLRKFRELAHEFSLAPSVSEPPWILESC